MRTRRQVLQDLADLEDLEDSVRDELRSIVEDKREAMRKLVDDHHMTTYELAHVVNLSQPRVAAIVRGARDARQG